MKITRHFTTDTKPVEDQIEWKLARASIPGAGFEMNDIEVPKHWSQTAVNILAQKYLRKAGVPSDTVKKDEEHIPEWLRASRTPDLREMSVWTTDAETSAKQVFHRLAGHWAYVGWKHGYFDSEADARAFYDELYYMLAMQIGAPNSPQFFNTGLWWAYGITGPDSGQWAIDYQLTEERKKGLIGSTLVPALFQPGTSYEYPQPHACFIQPVADDLVNPGGIMDLVVRESRLFKHGSGTGTNYSSLRGINENLSGGGYASGLMSFLEVSDRAAGAIKSGGVTRRAAKMDCLDLDHPESPDFIGWKVYEEHKAASMYIGSTMLANPQLREILYKHNLIPQAISERIENGFETPIFGIEWEGEAIRTVSGQNSNNSVRVTDDFLRKVDDNDSWWLANRTDKSNGTYINARELWNQICRAAWASADPGVQFHDTINAWNTGANDGTINASNPCGEYNYLDNTACNLASLNLVKFLKKDGTFDVESFIHATRLWTIVLDISVSMASFPSREIAEGSYNYRTLGLGYANVGGLLMRSGIAYDSDVGRDYIASITALMHGVTYKTSAELAAELGPFPRWEYNKESMEDVLHKHWTYVKRDDDASYIWQKAKKVWDGLQLSAPYRNAQTTLIAPTGTIALLMDCDTTGIEPEFSLKKTKLMAGGGTIDTTNQAVESVLHRLGYKGHEINLILNCLYIDGHLENAVKMSFFKPEHLAIFDCAVPPNGGKRALSPMAHVRMVAAVQPFLSGAVSKTVNLPNSATVADIDQIYREAHRLGIKSIALYRDGCKLTQPLNVEKKDASVAKNLHEKTFLSEETTKILRQISAAETDPNNNENISAREHRDDVARGQSFFIQNLTHRYEELKDAPTPSTVSNLVDNSVRTDPTDDIAVVVTSSSGHFTEIHPVARRQLPARRSGYTQKVKIDNQSLHLRTGEYHSGALGEIWLDFQRNGSTLGGILNAFAKAISIGLQYGVPLEEFVESFVHTKFEPAGIVQNHDRIKLCASLIDFVFRDLAISYLGQDDHANVKPEPNVPVEAYVAMAEDLVERGYKPSGEVCSACGGQLIQAGSCKVCRSCGTTNGGCG